THHKADNQTPKNPLAPILLLISTLPVLRHGAALPPLSHIAAQCGLLLLLHSPLRR
ncbi:hypothetical protein CCACVL1_00538, partial [Corchorus capsularis]